MEEGEYGKYMKYSDTGKMGEQTVQVPLGTSYKTGIEDA